MTSYGGYFSSAVYNNTNSVCVIEFIWESSVRTGYSIWDIAHRFLMGQLGRKRPETSVCTCSVQVPQNADTWRNKISYRYLRKLTHLLWLPCLACNIQKFLRLRPRRKTITPKACQSAHPVPGRLTGVKTAVICYNLQVYVCSISSKYTLSRGNQSLCWSVKTASNCK